VVSKDYMIGWCIFIPKLAEGNADIQKTKLNLKLITGPGVSLSGEIIWDQTLTKTLSNAKSVKLTADFSSEDEQVKPVEQPKPEEKKPEVKPKT